MKTGFGKSQEYQPYEKRIVSGVDQQNQKKF